MIDNLYFNDLSLEGLHSVDQIERLYNRLESLVDIFDLNELPDLKFIINIFSRANSGNQQDIIGLISNLKPGVRDYIFSQLSSSFYIDPPNEASLYFFNSQDISLVATYLQHENKNEILFSFFSHEDWERTCLEFSGEKGDCISFSHVGDINKDNPWIIEKLTQYFSYSDAIEFIEKIVPKFTSLLFNKASIEQIKEIDTDISKLGRLERCFQILNDYCVSDWSESFRLDKVNAKGVKLRGESQTTRDNPSYMQQRQFKDLDGNNLQFELHFDVTKAERCYVLPLHTEKKFLIGYIGSHLSTTRFN